MGMKLDKQRREALAREDTFARQYDIDSTRLFIFSQGRAVAGTSVDDVLKQSSQVPVRVSLLFVFYIFIALMNRNIECFFKAVRIWIQCIQDVGCGLHA